MFLAMGNAAFCPSAESHLVFEDVDYHEEVDYRCCTEAPLRRDQQEPNKIPGLLRACNIIFFVLILIIRSPNKVGHLGLQHRKPQTLNSALRGEPWLFANIFCS